MATTAPRPRTGARSGAAGRGNPSARRRSAEDTHGTKPAARPATPPKKARKPKPAAQNGSPHKATKPAAHGGSPQKATKPATHGGSPHKAGKPAAATSGTTVQPEHSSSGAGSGESATDLVRSVAPHPGGLATKAAVKLAQLIARRVLSSGTESVSELPLAGLRHGATVASALRHRALEAAGTSVDAATHHRPPIQASIDVAVPIEVAWAQWMRLEWLPEGVDSVVEVARNGDGELHGRLQRGDTEWGARVLDERPEESFAWESTAGTDCAGLITFHALGERLTRIELSLDIRPERLGQAASLAVRHADRRAQADLRRFKARLELISPDAYPDITD